MESESKMNTPSMDQGIWSPDVLYNNHRHSSGTGMTSTPYWPLSFKRLDESEGSSKQDSGYCSATPRSADSGGLFGKCRMCNKPLYRCYSQSSPNNKCGCKNPHIDEGTPKSECMEAIQEVKMSPNPKIPFQVRLNRAHESYEDAMDTSLYPEEMEVDHSLSGEKQCSLDFSELGEEKSIDFVEPHVLSASLGSAKATPSDLPSKTSTDLVNLRGSQSSQKLDFNFFKVGSEEYFSPEIFSCDLVSPKVKNESTPTKSKRGTPVTKMKKGSAFQSSAKKVATMNRVLRSFFPLNGIENVDFLYQLGVKKQLQDIVHSIFSFLSEKELDAVRVVSKTWNQLFHQDDKAVKRWQLYCTAMRLMKENVSSPVKQGGSGGRSRPALTRLQNVTNQTSPPRQPFSPQHLPFSPPVSPGSARFHSYQRAVRSLKKDERLLPCPKCRFPSTDHGSPVVQCPRSGCRNRFCVWCKIEVLPDLHHNCPPLYNPRCLIRKNTMNSVGSKSSKRNLRRL